MEMLEQLAGLNEALQRTSFRFRAQLVVVTAAVGLQQRRDADAAAALAALSSPVLQLAGGTAASFGAVLLGALSERQLKLYSYTST